jgi:thiol-disulfide isomerase/thioredoxin
MTPTYPVKKALVALALILLLALAACGAPAPASNNTLPMDEGAGEQIMDDEMGGDEMTDDDMPAGDMEKMDDMAGDDMDKMDDMPGDDMEKMDDMAGDDMDKMDDEMAGDGMADDAMTSDHPAPLWQTLPLVDARSGDTFTLAGFQGRRVFVEPMATWCSNCRQQLENVRAAQASAPEDAVFVALSVETSLSAAQLAQYAEAAGFDWTFAVMTPELLQALVDEFGRAIGNPPATPHFLIASDGSWSELATGIDSPEALLAQLEALP